MSLFKKKAIKKKIKIGNNVALVLTNDGAAGLTIITV